MRRWFCAAILLLSALCASGCGSEVDVDAPPVVNLEMCSKCGQVAEIGRDRCDREEDTCRMSASDGLQHGLCSGEHGDCRSREAANQGECLSRCGKPEEEF